MPTFTPSEYQAYLARTSKQASASNSVGVDKESELHQQILDECKRRGWIAFHGSMAHSTFRTPGEPDFVILADSGRVFLVECKTRTGKLTADQLAIHAWAKKIGHEVYTVRSLEEFLEIVR